MQKLHVEWDYDKIPQQHGERRLEHEVTID